MLHNEKFCIPLRCPTVLVHPKAQEKKSTAKGEEQQRGKAAERSSNKWGRAAEGKQQRGRATENKSSRGEERSREEAQQSGKSSCGKR